jgi:hypothetical protein
MAYAFKKTLLTNNLKNIIRQLFVWENLQIVKIAVPYYAYLQRIQFLEWSLCSVQHPPSLHFLNESIFRYTVSVDMAKTIF